MAYGEMMECLKRNNFFIRIKTKMTTSISRKAILNYKKEIYMENLSLQNLIV